MALQKYSKPSFTRDANTDLVRALAITLVLVHHVGQFLENLPIDVLQYFKLGAYGVDLFFVLSGWLIGGLYWREQQRFGDVQILRFWGRRWLRTLPPYFAVLPIAFLTVYFYRGETFDWRYLFFLQNYAKEMPFFLVSWSLAVEEHFYLILPLVLGLAFWLRININLFLVLVIILSILAKTIDPNAFPNSQFGYAKIASHLRFTGLLFGLGLSYVFHHNDERWRSICLVSSRLLPLLLLLFLTIPYWSVAARYYVGDAFVAVLFSSFLVFMVTSNSLNLAQQSWVKNLALCSYSLYLTHPIVINACVLLSDRFDVPRIATMPLWIVLILIVGWLGYRLVEAPSISIREKFIPRRSLGEATKNTKLK